MGAKSVGAKIRFGAVALTVLLHLLVLTALLGVTNKPPEPPHLPVAQEMSAKTLHGGGERIVSVDISTGLALRGIACERSSYIGVGVTADPRTDRIILVGDDTPASRAGLQHDDIVLNPSVWRDAHVEGALLRVEILRESMKLAVSVLVGKICVG